MLPTEVEYRKCFCSRCRAAELNCSNHERSQRYYRTPGSLARGTECRWTCVLLQYSNKGDTMDQAGRAYGPGRGEFISKLAQAVFELIWYSARLQINHGRNTLRKEEGNTGTTPNPKQVRGKCQKFTNLRSLKHLQPNLCRRKLCILKPIH